MKQNIYLILDNLRSAYNVGAIFRTADAVGVKKIFLCGITPQPTDEKQGNRRVKKTALGAEEYVEWEYCKSALEAIKKLKDRGVQIVSLEQTPHSLIYTSPRVKYKFPLALTLGNELEGIGERTLEKSDLIIHLPMLGKKKSLNVTSACAVMLYHLIHNYPRT
jgi:tRNA G18 (ribose-2'-O)-methylase SpoU